jgi:sterol 3beta-glucosyltransferase
MAGEAVAGLPATCLTGFWLPDDPAWDGWQPGHDLRAFMTVEPHPLALSFSSLPLTDPVAVLAVHARAAALLNRRLVVLSGWAGFRREHLPPDVCPEGVFFADALPHDWLFSQVDAAFVHGGIGSLARALRAGARSSPSRTATTSSSTPVRWSCSDSASRCTRTA